jgi:hypothetical protein
LIDGSILACDGFESFLGCDSSEESADRSKGTGARVTEKFNVFDFFFAQFWFYFLNQLYKLRGVFFVPGERNSGMLFAEITQNCEASMQKFKLSTLEPVVVFEVGLDVGVIVD